MDSPHKGLVLQKTFRMHEVVMASQLTATLYVHPLPWFIGWDQQDNLLVYQYVGMHTVIHYVLYREATEDIY